MLPMSGMLLGHDLESLSPCTRLHSRRDKEVQSGCCHELACITALMGGLPPGLVAVQRSKRSATISGHSSGTLQGHEPSSQ